MFAKSLSNIDLFGIPISINFSGKEKVTTSFGGICSLLFFVFVGWAAYNGIQDFTSTDNPQIISYESYSEDPREMILPLDEFPIAFAMRTPTDLAYQLYVDESIYKVNFVHSHLQRITLENGTTEEKWIYTPVALEKCKPSYFGELASSFADLNLDLMYCISKAQPELAKLKLRGTFTSLIYQTLTFTISQCDNTTSKIPCAPQEKIDSYLTGSWFSSLYGNMVINPRNYEHPNFKFKDLYYTMLSTENYRETEIDIERIQVKTDKGWILESPETANYVKVNKVTEFLQFEPNPQKVLISCIFQLSKIENYYSRAYKKIPGVLAEVGGLANAALIVLMLLTTPYFKIKFREALMNELFDVKMMPKKGKSNKPRNPKRKITKDTLKANDKMNTEFENHIEILSQSKNVGQVDQDNYKKLEMLDPSVSDTRSPEKIKFNFERTERTEKSPLSNTMFHASTASPVANLHREAKRESKDSNEKYSNSIKFQRTKTDCFKESEANLGNNTTTKSAQITLNEIDAEINHGNSDKKIGSHKEKSIPLKLKLLEEEEKIEQSHFSFESPKGDLKMMKIKSGAGEEISDKNTRKKSEVSPQEVELIKGPETAEVKSCEYVSEIIKNEKEGAYPDDNEDLEAQNMVASTKVDVTIWEYICSFFFKSTSLKQKMSVIDEGVKNIDERLDVINIMKKLREIDKLKALLLDHQQLVLFNNLPKPEIFPKGLDKLMRGTSFTHSILKRSKFIEECATKQQIMDCFDEIKYKPEKTEIDQKLLEIFSEKKP